MQDNPQRYTLNYYNQKCTPKRAKQFHDFDTSCFIEDNFNVKEGVLIKEMYLQVFHLVVLLFTFHQTGFYKDVPPVEGAVRALKEMRGAQFVSYHALQVNAIKDVFLYAQILHDKYEMASEILQWYELLF